MSRSAVVEAVEAAQASIANTRDQIELLCRILPPETRRAQSIVLMKLDEARMWMGECGA